MSPPNFDDNGINGYFAGASRSDVETFVDDLKSDFDAAIVSRFEVSSNYEQAIKDTPDNFKDLIIAGVEHYLIMEDSMSGGSLTVSGITGISQAVVPDKITIKCWIDNNGWGCEITIEK